MYEGQVLHSYTSKWRLLLQCQDTRSLEGQGPELVLTGFLTQAESTKNTRRLTKTFGFC